MWEHSAPVPREVAANAARHAVPVKGRRAAGCVDHSTGHGQNRQVCGMSTLQTTRLGKSNARAAGPGRGPPRVVAGLDLRPGSVVRDIASHPWWSRGPPTAQARTVRRLRGAYQPPHASLPHLRGVAREGGPARLDAARRARAARPGVRDVGAGRDLGGQLRTAGGHCRSGAPLGSAKPVDRRGTRGSPGSRGGHLTAPRGAPTPGSTPPPPAGSPPAPRRSGRAWGHPGSGRRAPGGARTRTP